MSLTQDQNCLLETNMFRWLKVISLASALVFFGIFAASCGSGNNAQARFVNAIPDANAGGLDVDVNGTKVTTGALLYGAVEPTPPAYSSVPSGSVTVQAYSTGTTSPPLLGANGTTVSLSSSTQYTEVLTGFNASPSLVSYPDNNTAPATGNIEFRVLHASPSDQTAVDVYIVPPASGIGGVTPNYVGLPYQGSTGYLSIAYSSQGYDVIVTPTGNKTPINGFNFFYNSPQNSIRTLVLVDEQCCATMSTTPLVLNDLN
jgi:hypothetical protein